MIQDLVSNAWKVEIWIRNKLKQSREKKKKNERIINTEKASVSKPEFREKQNRLKIVEPLIQRGYLNIEWFLGLSRSKTVLFMVFFSENIGRSCSKACHPFILNCKWPR